MNPKELYATHVPPGVRDFVSTVATGALIGAGTAAAGKLFQKFGGMTPPTEPPFGGTGSYAAREQHRRHHTSHTYRPRG